MNKYTTTTPDLWAEGILLNGDTVTNRDLVTRLNKPIVHIERRTIGSNIKLEMYALFERLHDETKQLVVKADGPVLSVEGYEVHGVVDIHRYLSACVETDGFNRVFIRAADRGMML